jgi:hypothetical protein
MNFTEHALELIAHVDRCNQSCLSIALRNTENGPAHSASAIDVRLVNIADESLLPRGELEALACAVPGRNRQPLDEIDDRLGAALALRGALIR